MSRRMPYRELAIVMGLALALPLWAKPLKKTIELYSPARVGNTSLPAGQYEMILNEKEATFEKNNKVVVETPYQWKQTAKAPTDAMLFDNDKLTGIEFSGKSQAIEFTDNSASVSPSPSSSGNR